MNPCHQLCIGSGRFVYLKGEGTENKTIGSRALVDEIPVKINKYEQP